MKARIGVDAGSGYVHTVAATGRQAANVLMLRRRTRLSVKARGALWGFGVSWTRQAREIKGNVGLEGGFGISAKPSTHKASLKGGQHFHLAGVAPPHALGF